MGGRVVEGTGLENRQARKRLGGSNPSPSATLEQKCECRSPPFPRHLKTQQPQKLISGAHDPDFALGDLDPLCESPQMVAPKSAVLSTHPAAGERSIRAGCHGIQNIQNSPHLSVYRYSPSMIASVMHRITGIVLCSGTLR